MNKTIEVLKRVEVWVESLTGLHTDVRQEQGEILAAIREVLAEPVCEHRIADARNEFVRDGYICIKCGALFRAADHAEPVNQEPVAYLANGTRFKVTLTDRDCYIKNLPRELGGRWVALIAAEDDCHLMVAPVQPVKQELNWGANKFMPHEQPVKQEPVAVVEITYGRESECYDANNNT